MKLAGAVLPFLLVPAALAAPAALQRQLNVVASILPVYSLTTSVAGNAAQVENLPAAGADAHDYQFTPRERRLLASADLIVVNGLQMEPWLQKALASAGSSRRVVECAAGLEEELLRQRPCLRDGGLSPAQAKLGHAGGVSAAQPNPHIWLDPLLACHMVTNILLGLEKADPANAATYASNAIACVARLHYLHEEIRRTLAPYKGSPIVTYHDAFPYFARRYDLNVVGVIEEVPEIDPSPKHLTALRLAIQRSKVKVIFTEARHSERLARQLGRDLEISVAPLDPLERGAAWPGAYEAEMRNNLRVLERFLK